MRHDGFEFAASAAGALLCLVALVPLALAWRTVRETTLVSAWRWSLAALLALAGAAALAPLLQSEHSASVDAVWFAAAALTFCPVVSVLGSKRPQHKAWNFVVLSLWAVVAQPAFEMLLLARGETLAVSDARGWFLWLLVALTPINYLATHYWLASLAVAAGQTLLLQAHLPLLGLRAPWSPTLGVLCIAAGGLAAVFAGRKPIDAVNAIDALWIHFRNSFGLLWALRVQERVNAFTNQQDLPCTLTWRGLRDRERGEPIANLPEADERLLRQTLSGLLRRFVSPAWMEKQVREDAS